MNTKILLLAGLLFLACEEDPSSINICDAENPSENLEWLAGVIEDYQQFAMDDPALAQYFYISQAQYQGATVIIIANCCPFCDSVFPVFNCQGDRIGRLGCREQDVDFNILETDEIIWSPDNFSCSESDILFC